MKVIRVEDYECTIEVGYQGENLARCIEWDLSKWVELYGEGTPTLLIMRADDTDAYPVVTDYTDHILRWCPTSADTAQMGIGEAQIIYTVDEVIAKKRVMSTEVLESLDNEADPPDPWQGWVDKVIQAKDDAESARDDAQAAQSAAEAAQAGAESAQESAEAARDLAEGSRDQAQTAQGAAESARDEAQTAQAGAESAQSAAETAQGASEDAANLAEGAMEDAEAWATGERGSAPVSPEDPTYHNNAKYYSEQSSDSASSAASAESGAQAAQSAAEIAQAAAEVAAAQAQATVLSAFATETQTDSTTTQIAVVETSLGADNLPLKELIINIGCVQEGSGDPSPSNPRPISARTIADVIVSPTADAADGTAYPITLNLGGTYLAQLNVTTGVLQIYGREMVVNGDPNDRGKRFISKLGDYTNATIYYTQPEDTYNLPFAAVRRLCTANLFKYNLGNSSYNNLLPWQFGVGNATQNIFFGFPKTSDYDTRDKVNAWAAANPIHAVVAYAESYRPAPIQLTPTEVRSILGTMKIWNEGGTVNTATYRLDPSLVYNELKAAIIAAT